MKEVILCQRIRFASDDPTGWRWKWSREWRGRQQRAICRHRCGELKTAEGRRIEAISEITVLSSGHLMQQNLCLNFPHTFYLRVRKASKHEEKEIFYRYDTGRGESQKLGSIKAKKSKILKDARNVDTFLQINNLTYHLAAEWSSISLCQSCSALPLSIHFDLCLLSSTFHFTNFLLWLSIS